MSREFVDLVKARESGVNVCHITKHKLTFFGWISNSILLTKECWVEIGKTMKWIKEK
jgi:hypothetical protein